MLRSLHDRHLSCMHWSIGFVRSITFNTILINWLLTLLLSSPLGCIRNLSLIYICCLVSFRPSLKIWKSKSTNVLKSLFLIRAYPLYPLFMGNYLGQFFAYLIVIHEPIPSYSYVGIQDMIPTLCRLIIVQLFLLGAPVDPKLIEHLFDVFLRIFFILRFINSSSFELFGLLALFSGISINPLLESVKFLLGRYFHQIFFHLRL